MTTEAVGPGPATPLGRNGDFIRLWVGEAFAGLGSAVTWLAYPLLALTVTRSAGLAGLLGLVALGASAVTRLPAGALVDRLPLRRVLVGADGLRIVCTGAVVVSLVTGTLALWQLLVLVALTAGAGAFSDVARSVALRHVVAPSQLSQVSSWAPSPRSPSLRSDCWTCHWSPEASSA